MTAAYTPKLPYAIARREALRQRVARHIEAHPGCTGNQIQAAIGGNRAVQLQAVRDLIGSGQVTRHNDPADRRIIRYTLTAGYQPAPEPAAPAPPRPKKCEHCRGPLPPRKKRFCSDLCRRRRQKAERVTENSDFAEWTISMINRMGPRASGDVEALTWLAAAADQARHALVLAVDGCRARGHSDAEIGQALGITRQAAWKRFPRQPQVDTELEETVIPA